MLSNPDYFRLRDRYLLLGQNCLSMLIFAGIYAHQEQQRYKQMRLLTLFIITLFMAACSSMPSQTSQQPKWSPEQYYDEARQAQAKGEHKEAIKYFSELEVHYPLSPYSQLAPVEIAYAYYKLEDFERAVNEGDRFISSYPEHANLDYAYYLKGLAQSGLGLGKSLEQPAQEVITDSRQAREAFKSFSTLVQGFPESRYRASAQQHMTKLRNLMAMSELQSVKAKIAAGDNEEALKMAKYIAEQYPQTAAATEALELVQQASSTVITPAAATEPMPSIQPVAPGLAAESINREPWLLQQNPQHFTLQLIGTSNQAKLEEYIKRHKLEANAAYFQRLLNDREWYSLLYGHYDSKSAAKTAATQLEAQLGLKSIWIRRLSDIQSQINQAQTGN